MIAIHLDAGQDSNGNPRRCYVVLDAQGDCKGVIDEGYAGRGALRVWAEDRGLSVRESIQLKTTPAEYRSLLKQAFV